MGGCGGKPQRKGSEGKDAQRSGGAASSAKSTPTNRGVPKGSSSSALLGADKESDGRVAAGGSAADAAKLKTSTADVQARSVSPTKGKTPDAEKGTAAAAVAKEPKNLKGSEHGSVGLDQKQVKIAVTTDAPEEEESDLPRVTVAAQGQDKLRPAAKRKLPDKATRGTASEPMDASEEVSQVAPPPAPASAGQQSPSKGAKSPEEQSMVRQRSSSGVIQKSALTLDNDRKLDDVYIVADLNKIGKGSFGKVTKATNRLTNALRAVKSISKHDKLEVDRVRQEVKIGRLLDHPNVVKLWEIFEDSSCIFLVMELCAGGSLTQHLKKGQKVGEVEAVPLAQQLLYAINYMHSNTICHRDVKPDNLLLLTKDPLQQSMLKLADFGLSKRFTPGQALTTMAGTLCYSAPQVFEGSYNESSDIWSCGVTLYHLLSGQLPFNGSSSKDVVAKIQRGNYTFRAVEWESVSDSAKDLVRGLLKYAEGDRWTAAQALLHEGLQEVTPRGARAAYLSLVESLAEFMSAPAIKKIGLQVIAQQLSETEVKELREIFIRLDLDGVGSLSQEMLIRQCKAHEIPLDRPPGAPSDPKLLPPPGGWQGLTLQEVLSDVCPVTYTAFLAMAMQVQNYSKSETLLSAFRFLDRNGDGVITQDDLVAALSVSGESGGGSPSKAEARKEATSMPVYLRSALEANAENKIGLEEFKTIMCTSS
mmetsp:Transcript_22907/g.53606  ORF Transcript_22907/g.53606 Transcript_22907/m.53606 type:complete len:703 (-) Transcript_22907:28-2136(-)